MFKQHFATYPPPLPATIDDVVVLVRHRGEMFAEMGTPRDSRFAAMLANSERWFRKHISDRTYLGFSSSLTVGCVAAGGGLFIFDWLPTHRDTGSLRGYILNVYVEIEHRRRGLARKVMRLTLADRDAAAEFGATDNV